MVSSPSFSHVLRFCRTRTSHTMGGFYNLYLPMILLMRSGDIETNPGPNTPESMVSEEELILLSELIDSSYYKRVGICLGISYTVLSGIKKRSDDDSDAFMQLFMRWRNRQPPGPNTRDILAEELQTCGLGDLSCRLLDGSLLSNRKSNPSVLPTSQTHEPLSPELIQKCAEDFKFKYLNTLCKIRADPLNPDSLVQFEDMYTNLVLEEEHGGNKRLREYNDLLNLKDDGKLTRRLLVQGEAGAGKTTLCAKIGWDWINGKHFQEFMWVIIVPLQDAKGYTIGEIAKSYLTSNNPTTTSQLTEYMHLNTDKVFIVFDGLDELGRDDAQPEEDGSPATCHKSHSLHSSQAQGQSSHSTCSTQHQAKLQSTSYLPKIEDVSIEREIRVEEILRSEKLETLPVMVTTRPWKAQEIRMNDRLRELYTFLYVEGFSRRNVATYIKKYFAGDEATCKAESLIQFANDNDVISENMVPYPIFIAMLCLIWREFDEEKQEIMKSLQTFSLILKEMFVFLKEHYALKMSYPSYSLDESLNDRLKDVNKLLEPIASLALNGLLGNTLVFREGDFEHCQDSMKTACRVGVLSEESRIILRKERHDASNPRMQSTVFFPHKLFQEYMAGIHLASLRETDNRQYNRLMEEVICPRKEEFRYLLYFTASQNQTVGIDVLTQIGRSIQGEHDQHFLVDVAFECHDTHAAAVIKDKVSPESATLEIQDGMTAHTVAGYAFIKTDMIKLYVDRGCGPTMSRNVTELICSSPSLREVVLRGELHNNFYTTLAAQGQCSKIQSLTVASCPDYASASHDLAVALCVLPNLSELTLDGMHDLHDEFYSTWKAMASSMKVQTLKVASCPDSAQASHDFAVALCALPNLIELTLDGMHHLHDEFYSSWRAMASYMKGCFPQIIKGNFTFNTVPQENLDSFLRSLTARQRSPRRTSAPSDHQQTSQSQVPADISGISEKQLWISTPSTQEQPPRTSPSPDHQQTSPTPCTVDQFSYSFGPGMSSSLKKPAPYTQSGVPDDISGVPEKQLRISTPLNPEQPPRTSPPADHHQPDCHQPHIDHVQQYLPCEKTTGTIPEGCITYPPTDLTRTSDFVDSRGKELSIPLYGFILSIPPGALEEGSSAWVTCDVLTSLPNNIKLNSDELIVSPGFQCYPSGLYFKKPVKLIIPHCGVFNDASRVRTVLISTDSQNEGEVLRTPLTQDACVVKDSHFEVSLEHFSGGHMVVNYDMLAVKGKHMLCMPYLPKTMPTSRKLILEFCLWNKPHDPAALREARRDDISQHVKDEEDEIFVNYKVLELTCQLDEDEPDSPPQKKIISYQVLFTKPKHKEYFKLDLNGKANDTSVTLEFLQDQIKIQEIMFHTRFAGAASSAVNPEDQAKPPRTVGDLEYVKLARNIGPDAYYDIGICLGQPYYECNKVLLHNGNNYTSALMDIFMKWNIQQQEENTREVLAVILQKSDLGALANKLRRGCLVCE